VVPLAPGQVGQPAADRLAGELGGDPVAVGGLPRGGQVDWGRGALTGSGVGRARSSCLTGIPQLLIAQ
jgi:hypothetical protein